MRRFVLLVVWLLAGCVDALPNTRDGPTRDVGQTLRLAAHTLRADDESLSLAQTAGFDTVVQVFPWREIEPTRGQFHWEVTDQMVAGAEYYGWISEMGWAVDALPDQPDIAVSQEQQAAYLTGAVNQVGSQWPWVELLTIWNLSPPDPGGPFGRYSLIGLDGTPRPAFEALRQVTPNQRSGPRGLEIVEFAWDDFQIRNVRLEAASPRSL